MDPTWEQRVKDAGSHLQAADDAETVQIKAAHLNDAVRCLLGVVVALAREVLPGEPDIP